MGVQIAVPQDIWVYPSQGAIPDLSPILAAQNFEAVFDASTALQNQQLDGVETFAATQTEDLIAMQKDLAAKGVQFDVDRMLRGSLMDRITDKWFDFWDWLRPAHACDADAGGSFEIVLAMTHPTSDIPFPYDTIFDETERVKNTIADVITKSKGVAPLVLNITEDDTNEDDWTDAQMFRADMADFDVIWPPVDGRPALTLAERQADGGLPIEVVLLMCDQVDYDRIVDLG